jgi:hypothetical protein
MTVAADMVHITIVNTGKNHEYIEESVQIETYVTLSGRDVLLFMTVCGIMAKLRQIVPVGLTIRGVVYDIRSR